MLTTSTASDRLPSPLGSKAKSMPCMRATTLQELETALHTLTAYSLAPGATPCAPAMMLEVCVPCPPAHGAGMACGPQSIGSGSGWRTPGFGQCSPRKSKPPMTLEVGKSPSSVVVLASLMLVPYAAV